METIVELDASPTTAGEVIDVMHRAFAQYSKTAEPSGALLETVESLRREMGAGVKVVLLRRAEQAVASAKYKDAGDGTLYFYRLGVVPEARGHHLSSRLIAALRHAAHLAGFTGLSCTVRANEQANIALYSRLGMEVTGAGTAASLTGSIVDVVFMRDKQ